MNLKIKKAFVLAGGFGTRLGKLSEKKPKLLMELNQKTVIEWNILNLQKFGVKEIVFGLGHFSDVVQNFLESNNPGLKFLYDVEPEPLGTGGALKNAEKFFNETFIFCNGDEAKNIDYSLVSKVHKENNALGTLALKHVEDVENFGAVKIENNQILEFFEKPSRENAPSNLVNAGASILEPEIFNLMQPDTKISIEKDVFPRVAKQGRLFGIEFPGQWFPIDTEEKLLKAQKEWQGF